MNYTSVQEQHDCVPGKQGSHFEHWRQLVSRIFVVLWLTAAVLTVPKGFGAGWHEAGELVGFLLLIVAALGRMWSLAYIGGRKDRELCQSGPYSIMRNPRYFFSFLAVVGTGLALQQFLVGFIAAISFLLYYAGVIRHEERRLRVLHGTKFEVYRAQVPRFWPRMKLPFGPEVLQVNMRLLTRGLCGGTLWFLLAIIFAEMVEWLHGNGLFMVGTLPF